MHEKLIYSVQHGDPFDTIDSHRQKIWKEVKALLRVNEQPFQDYTYRNQLITLLVSTSKSPVKEIPLNEQEWTKLLNQWVKTQILENIIFNREIYEILAVDGFDGFRPAELKNYLRGILKPIRNEFKMHENGIRAMYRYIAGNPLVASLPGTHSGCIIFLALLKFYATSLVGWISDNQTMLTMENNINLAEAFLHDHSDYYRDIQNISLELLNILTEIYLESFNDFKHCVTVSKELLKKLN